MATPTDGWFTSMPVSNVESEECAKEYGKGPLAVLAERGALEDFTTLVHATHLDQEALALLDNHRPTVCACPTTERNLGDGFLPTQALLERGIPIALGSDGQSQIDLWTDARLIEYHERLRDQRRNVVARLSSDEHGRRYTAQPIWPMLNRRRCSIPWIEGWVLGARRRLISSSRP